MNNKNTHDLRTGYDTVAQDYAERISSELEHKPLDRSLLEEFAERVRDIGLIADIGCGPGHVGRYLHDLGVGVVGIDLSPRMIECARELHPTIEFQQADMMDLPVAKGTWAGIVAFYSIIHIPRNSLVATLREFRRVLQPEGLLLLAFHVGAGVLHMDECLGHRVSMDLEFYSSDEIDEYLTSAGFQLEWSTERDPYPPEVEYQSRRGYILARRGETANATRSQV